MRSWVAATRGALLVNCRPAPTPSHSQFPCPGGPITTRRERLLSMQATAGREVVSTEKAPGAVGPYSQAIKTGDLIFVSGQVGLIPGTKDLAGDGVDEQTEQVMKNLGAVLEAAGSSYGQVLKTTVLLTTMGDFQPVNAIYGKYFEKDPPARACFAVKELPLGAKVEIEAIASL